VTAHDAGRGHERARELAALRADEFLPPEDEAWLADHLDFCDACAVVAAEYDAQHDLFADLRAWTPEPPRDLWARTAAAIEAERRPRAAAPGWRLRDRSPRAARRLTLAPVAAVVAVVVIVGAGLLNTVPLGPGVGTTGATPIALTAAADIQVIGRDRQGNVQILSRPVGSVCPVGVAVCGAQPTFAVTSVSGVQSATTLQGAISPSGDRMVVVAKDAAGEGVYIVPVRSGAASPAPAKSAVPVASSTAAAVTPSPSPSASASLETTASTASTSPDVSASPVESPATASAFPVTSASPAATPSDAATGSPDATATATTPAPASPSATPSAAPTTLPSVEVTPAPDAAIKIASGVTVVGTPMYAPDGVHLAFAAMPSNGSAGPDIYVWTTGDKTAQAITSDHTTWLAAWTPDGILVSRVASGTPATFLLDRASGHATPVGDPGIWLPSLSPDGSSAAWWDGTVKLAADGVTWVPDAGKLVAGSWPVANSGGTPQVLAKGPLAAWQVRWSADGTAVAVWTVVDRASGKLSLYRVDPATNAADLADPMLDAAPANPDFSLRTGRLAWTTPTQGVPQVVEVLAWSGKTIGHIEVPADGSGTVVP